MYYIYFLFFEATGIIKFYLPVLKRCFCIFLKLKTKDQTVNLGIILKRILR